MCILKIQDCPPKTYKIKFRRKQYDFPPFIIAIHGNMTSYSMMNRNVRQKNFTWMSHIGIVGLTLVII